MSDLFFEIMNLQPNENEFRDAVRNSRSNETAYQIGFMHGRSYAAQMADGHVCIKRYDDLKKALHMMVLSQTHPKAQRKARELLLDLGVDI